jgi:hypothetical protein
MAGCPAQHFTGITPEVLACLQAKGAAAGLPLAGDTGHATTMGVTIRWNYDPTAQTLTIECTEAPFFVPCSTIAQKVKDLIEGCKPQNA